MKITKLFVLINVLFCVWQRMFAENQAYAILDVDGKLTFYYDGNKPAGGYDIPWNDTPAWYKDCESIKSVEFQSSFRYFRLESTAHMFQSCVNLTSINLCNLNVDFVIDMSYMFEGCSSLTSVELPIINSSIVQNLSHMFEGCSSLTSLDFSNFKISIVQDMSYMFAGCSSLTSLDLSSFNTLRVKDMSYMFAGCSSLVNLDLSKFNTKNTLRMDAMFKQCSSLTSLDLRNFIVNGGVVDYMFAGCSSLKTIYCNDDWGENYCPSMRMFSNCSNLVGGQGTTYDTNNYDFYYDIEYAHPDGGVDSPGFFTYQDIILTLNDNQDNSTILSTYENKKIAKITLIDRTLYRDGRWNTLCLPFNVGDKENCLVGTLLEDATVMTLSEDGTSFNDGVLSLNFVNVSYIEAGKPYIIKWEDSFGLTDLINPIFTNITISNASIYTNKINTQYVNFIGNYAPVRLNGTERDILYLGAGNTLYYPNSRMNINSFRARFLLNGLTVSENDEAAGPEMIRSFNLNFGEEENAIRGIKSETTNTLWYTLDGHKLIDEPIQKRIYFHDGKKVIIK